MKIFTINKEYSIVCDTKSTRSGFKHVAILCRNGYEIGSAKVCYLNRTWERFTYETVLRRIIDVYFTEEKEKNEYLTKIEKEN